VTSHPQHPQMVMVTDAAPTRTPVRRITCATSQEVILFLPHVSVLVIILAPLDFQLNS
jgi:hypothetical protein